MTLDVERVCPSCRRFWHGAPGRLPFPSPRGVVCNNEGHALRRRPDPVVVLADPLPVTLEATAGEVWVAETVADRIARGKRDAPNRHAEPRRDRRGQDRDATLAEQLVARHYGEEWTGRTAGAVDVGGIWEVRSIVNPTYGLLIRETDRDLPTFLVLVDDRLCHVLGWEAAAVVRARGRFHAGENGESDYWTLAQPALRRDNPPR